MAATATRPRLLEKCQELDAECFDDAVDIARMSKIGAMPSRSAAGSRNEGEDEVVVQIRRRRRRGASVFSAAAIERRLLAGAPRCWPPAVLP